MCSFTLHFFRLNNIFSRTWTWRSPYHIRALPRHATPAPSPPPSPCFFSYKATWNVMNKADGFHYACPPTRHCMYYPTLQTNFTGLQWGFQTGLFSIFTSFKHACSLWWGLAGLANPLSNRLAFWSSKNHHSILCYDDHFGSSEIEEE